MKGKGTGWFALFVLLLLILWVVSERVALQPRPQAPQSGKDVSFPAASFRITFGLTDTEQSSWDGQIPVSEGQVITVEADEFRDHNYDVSDESKFPNDYVRDRTSWVCSTRQVWMRYSKELRLHSPTLLAHVWDNPSQAPVRVKTAQREFSFDSDQIRPFQSRSFLDGAVRVERVPVASAVVPDQLGQQDFPSILATGSGDLWMAWQEYEGQSDSVYVRGQIGEAWGNPVALVQDADVLGTALGEDSGRRLWAVWSMQVRGNWDLYAAVHDGSGWSEVEKLTYQTGPDIYHKLVSDSRGRLWLVWQRTAATGYSQISAKRFDGKEWSESTQISEDRSAKGNNWWPEVAAGTDGSVVVVWDGYASGSSDVYMRQFVDGRWKPVKVVAGTERFEANPSVAVDGANRIWIAWQESDVEWGKDTGLLAHRQGTQLHESRWIRVVCLDGEEIGTPIDPLSRVLRGEFWELPHLQIDSGGGPWLFVRHMMMRRPDARQGPRGEMGTIYFPRWSIYATRYQGSQWSEPMYMPHSSGRNDMQLASALDSTGQLWAAWPTDNRTTKSYMHQSHQVFVARLFRSERLETPKLRTYVSDRPVPFTPIHPDEANQVKRIRSYEIENRGKSYSIYRGDLHRHTDLSIDAGGDGSLLDAYRYARDAASLDFLGISDHTNDVGEPYAWWFSQKYADLFQLKDFVSLYGYERSLPYPNGHRNVFFIERGVPVLQNFGGEQRGWVGADRLFWYLRRYKGTSIPHTSGTMMGTDWRDNDPKVEHLVEIFQGMRETYEYPGAPQPKTLAPSSTLQEDDQPHRRFGSVWNALGKGYKLGFIASSDHHSTHMSYACLIAESLTREALLEAVRSRRAYAATDNIILDIRASSSQGEHLMGEEFSSRTPIRVKAKIIGTGPIRRVDVIKDNRIVYTTPPAQPEHEFEFVETDVTAGENYYYVRVIQENGEIAWGSPFWVRYEE